MTGKVLHLKLLRLVPLFKSESEAKVLENIRFSQLDICLLLHEINSKSQEFFLLLGMKQ